MDKQTAIRILTQKLNEAIADSGMKSIGTYMPAAGKIVAYETALEVIRQLPDDPIHSA